MIVQDVRCAAIRHDWALLAGTRCRTRRLTLLVHGQVDRLYPSIGSEDLSEVTLGHILGQPLDYNLGALRIAAPTRTSGVASFAI